MIIFRFLLYAWAGVMLAFVATLLYAYIEIRILRRRSQQWRDNDDRALANLQTWRHDDDEGFTRYARTHQETM